MNNKKIAVLFLIVNFLGGCNNRENPSQDMSTTVAEKNTQVPIPINGEIKIGTQIWDADNLSVSTFKNGDRIPQAKTDEAWQNAGTAKKPAWCYYQNDSIKGKKYGKLYNWYAVNDKRGLAPKNKHISTHEEWKELTTFLAGESVTGAKLKSTEGWKDAGNGTNTTGFSALPGGYRFLNGGFNGLEYFGGWWCSTENYTNSAFFRSIRHDDAGIYTSNYGKEVGFSVRCIKD